jgi:mono/diheme cytochrome c family protein
LNDPTIREKDSAVLERTVRNGVPATLMAGWDSVLSAEEINALLALITRWDEVPSGTIPEPDQPVAVTAESLALGADLYSQSCARCHGPTGQGTQRAPALNVKSFLTATNDSAMEQIITLGVPGTAMPVWGDRMTEAQIQAIVGFVRSWEPNAPEVAQPVRRGGGPWWKSGNNSAPSLPGGGVTGSQATPTDPLATTQPTDPQPTQQPAFSQTGTGQGSGPTQGQGPGHSQGQPTTAQLPGLDWRVAAIIGILVLVSLIIIVGAADRLRRLPA